MNTSSRWKLLGAAAWIAAATLALASEAADARLTPEMLGGKQFRFSWKTDRGSGFNGTTTLCADGTISGIGSPNESFWLMDRDGRLIFKHRDGRVSTIFTRAEQRDGRWFFSGPFQFNQRVQHVLEEVPAATVSLPTAPKHYRVETPASPTFASDDDPLNRAAHPYSKQRIVCLNPGESHRFTLGNGSTRTIRLVSAEDHRDRVNNLVRRADVRVAIDGRPLELVCGPYVMPTETAGLRIQADITTGWNRKPPKRVQFSLWDAADPIVDTTRFVFPIRNFRLFSQGMQAYLEPLHLGRGDGDPAGLRGYHDYGFDMAGYEGGEEIVSATDGVVLKFWPNEQNRCAVVVQDAEDCEWGYVHLATFAPELAVGARVRRGQKLGTLGKTGPSGNFAHLHFSRRASGRNLNVYPWLVTAYQAEHPKGLLAVARPHHAVLTGEKELFDGSNSLAFGGRKIVEWRWVFHDGETVRQAKAEKAFDKPGAYVAELWVKDDRGGEDVDFCQIKAFFASAPERAMPHIFMTSTPTESLRPGQPVRFRFWFQGRGGGPMTVDFGDGTRLDDYRSYTEHAHGFQRSGIHIVTVRCEADGKPITNKLKVVVTAPDR
ncbi:MAG: PKD domain-containing protein [Verrucomicrobia bacterium]|nr:PKD domain-containing protein [Verrucomicrobiota bacterium]